MKKTLVFMIVTALFFALPGCKSECTPKVKLTPADHQTEKNWSEKDIETMFSQVKKENWEYIDCVLIPDNASDCVGAILFWDVTRKSSNVAFFDADGYYQQCGVDAKPATDPEFTYLGNGSVTFQLQKEDGISYDCMLTISIDENNVQFRVEDDFRK